MTIYLIKERHYSWQRVDLGHWCPFNVIYAGPMQRYCYTDQLLEFERRRPARQQRIPVEWSIVRMPMVAQEWEIALRGHPDRQLVEYLLEGMRQGFHIGFRHDHECKQAKSNMKSAVGNPEVVDQYLSKEVGLGRVVGTIEPQDALPVHISRFGVIPKPSAGQVAAHCGSVTSQGLLCSLTYTSVDKAVQKVLELGTGIEMAKFDVESVYRTVPVHPDDRRFLGMQWKGGIYVDTVLPFRLRSAPKIYNALADAMQWIIRRSGSEVLHYLDDFLIFGPPGPEGCGKALARALDLCARLGVPIAAHKTEGPATRIIFLGIEQDSVSRMVQLPEKKLVRLQTEVRSWRVGKDARSGSFSR